MVHRKSYEVKRSIARAMRSNGHSKSYEVKQVKRVIARAMRSKGP